MFMDAVKQRNASYNITVGTKDTPWITDEIRLSIANRNKAYNKGIRANRAEDRHCFAKARNFATTKVRDRKTEHLQKLNKKSFRSGFHLSPFTQVLSIHCRM